MAGERSTRGGASTRGAAFASLRVRNFRLFYLGEGVSITGSFMQFIAQAWLVLELTDNAASLGLVAACQFLPTLLVGPYAGVVGDRLDKRKLLITMQLWAMVPALLLGILTATGHVQLWMVLVLALVLGLCGSFDGPARNAFVLEMVGRDLVTNAVSLNTTLINVGRLFGPVVAGATISLWGIAPCFVANAASYLLAAGILLFIRRSELHPTPRVERAAGQLRAGVRTMWGDPALRIPLLMMVVLGTLSFEWAVTIPVAAREVFDVGAGGYGVMQTFISVGAIAGGLYVASRVKPTHRWLVGSTVAVGVALTGFGLSPTYPVALLVLVGLGVTSVMFTTLINAALQLAAPPEMRSRVMSFFALAWTGTTPIGGPIIGWISQTTSVRVGLCVGGAAAFVTAAVAWPFLRRTRDPALEAADDEVQAVEVPDVADALAEPEPLAEPGRTAPITTDARPA